MRCSFYEVLYPRALRGGIKPLITRHSVIQGCRTASLLL